MGLQNGLDGKKRVIDRYRPEKIAIGKACLPMFTGIDSLAMGSG
jgi:hypothetical protein